MTDSEERPASAAASVDPSQGSYEPGGNPYRELFERSADAILIIEDERFVDCNEATVEMLRLPDKAAVLRTHPSELSPELQPDGRRSFEKANEMIRTAFERGSHRFEWDHVRADGEVFPVEVLLTAVESGAKPTLHVVWRDITSRRKLETELRQALKMEAIGKLAGGIAHDFNNLLVSILGNSELLEASAREAGCGAMLEQIGEIRAAGERAAELVRQLLAFSRKQPLQPSVVDLSVVLCDLERMLGRLIGEDVGLEIARHAEPLLVKADPGQLQQVILNLATNARDAMPEGGTLRIATRRIEVASESEERPSLAPGRYAVLEVRDDGRGMDAATVSRIFEPFFTTKAIGRGTGLGLSTVYGIVRQSGGDITVTSEPGRGTTFEVLLPETSEQPGWRPRATTLSGDELGGSESILVVEDEPPVARLLVQILQRQGYRVEHAANGVEALALIGGREETFDLVLSDMIMPLMGGPELARRLRAQRPDLKILFASGYSDEALGERGFLEEGVELVRKPFTPSELLYRVRTILDA